MVDQISVDREVENKMYIRSKDTSGDENEDDDIGRKNGGKVNYKNY